LREIRCGQVKYDDRIINQCFKWAPTESSDPYKITDALRVGRNPRSMLRRYFKRLLERNKTFFFEQARAYKGFVHLFFKRRNTGEKWTKEEKKILKGHLKTMALSIPALIVFLPPGGSIFLPVLVDLMDRRKEVRRPQPGNEPAPPPATGTAAAEGAEVSKKVDASRNK
jgi:hypothetical protein